MARKWSNLNLPGALHFVTGNCINRLPVFTEPACCMAFLAQLQKLNKEWPAKLIAYVLMPDNFHFISNPRDGCIIEFCRDLKAKLLKPSLRQVSVSLSCNRRWPPSLAGELQGLSPGATG
jgi:REP element-mobilizing transposase RayT